MGIPTPIVKVATGAPGIGWRLDDPVYGLVDNGNLIENVALATATATVHTIEYGRGRSRQLDSWDAGQITVSARNHTRVWDPVNTASPLYGACVPGRMVKVAADIAGTEVPVVAGWVDDLGLEWTVEGAAEATLSCVDTLGLLAATELEPHAVSAELAGERVAAILSRPEVAAPGVRRIADGVSAVAAGSATGNTLDYLSTVARSEQGYLFCAADGALTFAGRRDIARAGAVLTISDTWAPGTIRYNGLSVQYGAEELFTRAVVTDATGAEQVQYNAAGTALYGVRSTEPLTSLLSATDAALLAGWLTSRWGSLELRPDTVDIELAGLTAAEQAQVLAVEIGDVVTWEFHPPHHGGTPGAITGNYVVESVAGQVQVDPGSWRVRWSLGPAALRNTAIVGPGQRSRTDSGNVAGY